MMDNVLGPFEPRDVHTKDDTGTRLAPPLSLNVLYLLWQLIGFC
jgi:hypothetical protein